MNRDWRATGIEERLSRPRPEPTDGMPEWSRRRALRAAATAALAGLAGCSGETSVSHRAPVDPNDEPVTEYTVKQVRTAEPTVLFWTGDEPPADGNPGRTHHLTSDEELADLSFAADLPEAETLERFVRSVDLETQSVYLHAQAIEECYDLVLQGVSRDESSVHVDLCRDLKPADAVCSADAETTVGLAIRLPFAGDDFHGLGMGYGSSCHPNDRPVDFEPSTPTNDTNRTEGDA